MRNRTFIINIGWCPDSVDADEIQELLDDAFGVSAEVVVCE